MCLLFAYLNMHLMCMFYFDKMFFSALSNFTKKKKKNFFLKFDILTLKTRKI